ncbi:MAG TPA: molybdenum cofactor biosynthesis protein MoaE [Burkholderiaceae bacterium]|nr:molybdenum cofactor biosynthesis protein MoaE [Burkholderiaceae bacterium]
MNTPLVTVQEADFDAARLTADLRARNTGAVGAIVAFTGYVRDYTPEAPTHSLYLEHYPGMCEREITELCETAMQRWDILDCLVVHRVGELDHTEQIVYVGVAGAHRGQSFRACEFIIDTLKTRAPFWKRETLSDGHQFWVEQRESDARKTASWQDPAPTTQTEPANS